MSFRHLAPAKHFQSGRDNSLSARIARINQLSESEYEDSPVVDSHSVAHRIAVSQEANNNPVLALKLIQRGEESEDAISLLADSHRELSQFTQRRMEKVCPGWECLDDEDKNLEAFNYSVWNNDVNGYWAGIRAAITALEKYVEQPTLEDINRLMIKLNADRN
ncbi:hypothetical protein [Serratia fonticola]|uniref:hypothetical protein n=1 Tax=Serratia fonticola TaxID=47917 RepID=UPI00192CF696|nr:hypothetical protein [Serratia fonticola]MBL5827652.1 hypothetical protein [Serratia fonticola]